MANKQQERIYLEWFLNKSGINCRSIEDAERPDFYLDLHNKRVAAEITTIHCEPEPNRKGSKSKQQEARREQWLRALSDSYYESSDIPIWVQILLPSAESYREVEDDVLLGSLREVSVQLAVWEQKRCCVETESGTAKLFVTRLPNDLKSRRGWSFQNNEFGIVLPITEDHILRAVREKQPKSGKYRTNCDEVWLLIVADPSCQSGMLQYDPLDLDLENRGFDAIWLLEHLHRVHQLMGSHPFTERSHEDASSGRG
jgi:hypothetical protein